MDSEGDMDDKGGFDTEQLIFKPDEFDRVKLKNSVISISEINGILQYKDLRSAVNWCKKNKVFIMKQGNLVFANKIEFLLAFQKPFIEYLKRKHKDWQVKFIEYISGNFQNLLNEKKESKKYSNKRYKPQTITEKTFLNKIKQI